MAKERRGKPEPRGDLLHAATALVGANNAPQSVAPNARSSKRASSNHFDRLELRAAAERGLIPGPTECIGFSVPLVFKQGGSPDTPYIIDIYENVGFLGDLHKQIATLPDGARVKLVIK